MTQAIENTDSYYVANGSTTNFSFSFSVNSSSEVIVLSNGVAATGYSFADPFPIAGGSNVIFSTAPVNGTKIAILRNTELTNEVNFDSTTTFLEGDHEKALDKVVRAQQDLSRDVREKSIRIADSDEGLTSGFTVAKPGNSDQGKLLVLNQNTPPDAIEYSDVDITSIATDAAVAQAAAAAAAVSETNTATSEANALTYKNQAQVSASDADADRIAAQTAAGQASGIANGSFYTYVSVSGTVTAIDGGAYEFSSSGTINLPTPGGAVHIRVLLTDNSSTLTFVRAGTELINGIAQDAIVYGAGFYTVSCYNGIDWLITQGEATGIYAQTPDIYAFWSNAATYDINEIVNYNGLFYRNLTGTNTTTVPDADENNWERYEQNDFRLKVKNVSGATITKGKVVYISGASGNNPEITLADKDSEITSSKTFGVVVADILNNEVGYIVTEGVLENIDLSTFTDGAGLWLGDNGGLLSTIPLSPAHAVFIGYVLNAATNGKLLVGIQNGYELEEIHDVLITSPVDGQVLQYSAASGLWKNETLIGGGGGEANTASNVGTAGVGIFKQKTGVNFEFKKVNAGSNKITVTDDTGNNEVDIDVDESNLSIFTSTTKGVAPASGGGTTNYLRADGTWATPPGGSGGSGDVVGPASATDNAIARFDTTTGKLIQDSAVTIDDSGNISTSGTVDGRDISVDGSKLDGIEANATADQTAAEIKIAYESNANTNAYTDAEKTKLAGIETAADVTDAANVSAAGAPIISSGAGAPTSTPTKVGDIYIDTTADDAYIAVGIASSADWEKSNDGGGSGGTTYYTGLRAPQLFNPDATAVTNNTDDYTLVSSDSIGFVTLNGQVLDDSEYSLSGTTLTVTPDNGFNATTDEVLVFQHNYTASGANIALLDTAQEYTATQNFNATTLTDGATINWDASVNQVTSVTLAGNRTLAAPTNLADGATYILIIKQDATGGRTLTFNTAYKFPGGTVPTLSTAANAVDIITFVSDGANMYGVAQKDFK